MSGISFESLELAIRIAKWISWTLVVACCTAVIVLLFPPSQEPYFSAHELKKVRDAYVKSCRSEHFSSPPYPFENSVVAVKEDNDLSNYVEPQRTYVKACNQMDHGAYEDAVRTFIEARTLFKESPSFASKTPEIEDDIAACYIDLGRASTAVEFLNNLKTTESPLRETIRLMNLGEAYFFLGNDPEAKSRLEGALKTCKTLDSTVTAEYWAEINRFLGLSELFTNDANAVRHLAESVNIQNNSPYYAQSELAFAASLQANGQYSEAAEHFQRLAAGDKHSLVRKCSASLKPKVVQMFENCFDLARSK